MPQQLDIISFLESKVESPYFFRQKNSIYETCRANLMIMEQQILSDKPTISKLRKTLKNLISDGKIYSQHQQDLGICLEELFTNNKFVSDTLELQDCELGFVRFGVLLREISKLQESLLFFASSTLLPLLDSILETFSEIKHNKTIERSNRIVESKLYRDDEELENSQKILFCNICDILIKMQNATLRRNNVLPLAFCDFFDRFRRTSQESLNLFDEFESFMKRTRDSCHKLKSNFSSEKERAGKLRDRVSITRSHRREVYEMEKPQTLTNVSNSVTDYLFKRTEGFIRGRNWSRRLCSILDGNFYIYHSATSKTPVMLDLVACELKVSDSDRKDKQFRIFHGGSSRVYLFKAKNAEALNRWSLVFNNAKARALSKAFGERKEDVKLELWRISDGRCADCGDEARDWVSVNLGVVLCLKCCGIHREMGVHVSRTCSVSLDCIGTCHLVIFAAIGNEVFNRIFTANLTQPLIFPASTMEERREFIMAKYIDKKFVSVHTDSGESVGKLKLAISLGSVVGVLELYAQNYYLMINFDDSSTSAINNSLVFAVSCGDSTNSLAIVDFIAQNVKTDLLLTSFSDYESVFHFALINGHLKSLQILLKVYPRAIEKWKLVEVADSLDNGHALKLFNAVKYRDVSVVNNFIRSDESESLSSNHSDGDCVGSNL